MSQKPSTLAHIGVAVRNASDAAAFYRDILGVQPKPEEEADGARIVSLTLGDIDVELLEPITSDGPVAKFLATRGPGIHHMCFRVPDLEGALQRCRDRGYRLVDETPRQGAHGRSIAFLHPKSTSGILIELTEY